MTSSDRTSEFPIDQQFLDRWSPRAFTGAPISEHELFTILEAARWAPSAFNSQPWRFIYARRDTEPWACLLELLIDFNKSWVGSASAHIFIISKTTLGTHGAEKDSPLYSHSFDAGAAWACLALQAAKSGWAAHAMTGFDVQMAISELGVPPAYRLEAAVAIGRRGDASVLPEKLRAREGPSSRMPLNTLVSEGRYADI